MLRKIFDKSPAAIIFLFFLCCFGVFLSKAGYGAQANSDTSTISIPGGSGYLVKTFLRNYSNKDSAVPEVKNPGAMAGQLLWSCPSCTVYYIWRDYFSFDTSSLAGKEIVSGKIIFKADYSNSVLGKVYQTPWSRDFTLELYTFDMGSAFDAQDWDAYKSGNFLQQLLITMPPVEGTGLTIDIDPGLINFQGKTRFALISQNDRLGLAPTGTEAVALSQISLEVTIREVPIPKGPWEILDGADFSSGREVSAEPAKVAIGGTPVEGAVTDGVTRLLLRLSVNKPGPVTLTLQGTGNPQEDGILKSLDGGQQGNSITVNSVTIGEEEKALIIYQAPENFVRLEFKSADEKISERVIPVKLEFISGSLVQEKIRLVRPPLILVHGLWSGPEMWNDFKVSLQNKILGIKIYAADYKETNASRLADNKDVPYSCKGDSIIKAKDDFRQQKIAMVQADVMGHSMGGVLARIFMEGDKYYYDGFYRNDKNFGKGSIHKLITLDSPHQGSFLADIGLLFIQDTASGKFKDRYNADLIKLMAFMLALSDGGALGDLSTSSKAIALMNTVDKAPYFYAIAGDFILDSFIMDDGIKAYILPDNEFRDVYALLAKLGYSISPYIMTGKSDLVVSLDSQEGGASGLNISIYNHYHAAATTDIVLERVVELLNGKE